MWNPCSIASISWRRRGAQPTEKVDVTQTISRDQAGHGEPAFWRAAWSARQFVFGLAAAAALLATPLAAQARSAPDSFADLVEDLLPAVVNIATTQMVETRRSQEFEEFFKEFFERRGGEPPRRERRRASSLGSGFIIDPSGYIVTNNHVIAEADEISVRLSDDTSFDAKVVGRDEKTDLALLKVDSPKPLPAVSWGDSDKTRIGDWIVAIGNPFGLGGTVTAGIVSALQRDINTGSYDDYIQSDAAINRGNSGGPMFNIDGEVIGVNTAIFSPSGGSVGIGFAIPAALAQNIVEQLRDFGEVRRGWLGVRIQSVTEELAEGLRLDKPRGALVASVTPEGPAEKAGIQQGDVIIRFDGREVPEMRKLPRMVAETRIGKAVPVVVWRKGEEQTFQVTLGELDDEKIARASLQTGEVEQKTGEVAELGLALGQITPELRERFELDEKTKGVVITDVDETGSAAEKGLQPGDVIVEVDQEEVASPAQVAEGVKKAREEGFRVVTLLVYRQGDFRWVAVRIDQG